MKPILLTACMYSAVNLICTVGAAAAEEKRLQVTQPVKLIAVGKEPVASAACDIPDSSTIHALAARLGKGNWANYEHAFNTLVRSGKAAVPALVNVIKNGDAQPRSQAAMVLLHIGHDAKDAIPALVEMLKDEKEYMRNCAANALGYIGGNESLAVAALTDALSDEAWRVRFFAANALFTIGCSSPGTDGALVRATDDKHEWVRGAAARALTKIRSLGSSRSAHHKSGRIRRMQPTPNCRASPADQARNSPPRWS